MQNLFKLELSVKLFIAPLQCLAFSKRPKCLRILSEHIILTLIKGYNSLTNLQKMTANNPNIDLISINSYLKSDQNLSICSQDIEQKRLMYIKGHNSGTSLQKMMCNNAIVYFVDINAYIKFGEILTICSQDIERKRNFGVNLGP